MKKILYVLHSGITGGTFLTNKDLMKNVERNYEVYLLSAENNFLNLYSFKNNELNIIKSYIRNMRLNVPLNDSTEDNNNWSAGEFHNAWLSFIYFDILIKFDIDLVHIRHLINHSFDLPQIAKKLNIPVILSFHDYYFICPFYVLLDDNYDYCAGNCERNDGNCYCPMDSLKDINSKQFVHRWRLNVLKMFQYVDFFITTSDIVKNLFLNIYDSFKIFDENNFRIIEHGRDFPNKNKDYFEPPSLNKPVKILCPANHLNLMKGSELIKQIKKEDNGNFIEFHFLGNCHDGIEEYGISHGTFDRDEFYKKVDEINPSFIGIFSVWPETFCHTLTEAWSCGIPVIGTNIGAVEDRIRKNKGGIIVDRKNPKKIYSDIISLVKDDSYYFKLIDNINKINLKDTKSMASEYIDIYDKLLKR